MSFARQIAGSELAANEPMDALGAVLAAVEMLRSEVVALREEVAGLRGSRASGAPRGGRRLLSMRAAANALGVSRNTTLPSLIRDRRLGVVIVNGRPKVPMDEIERIEREGTGVIRPVAGRAKRPIPDRSRAPLARDLV